MARQVTVPDWVAAATRIEVVVRQTTYWDLAVCPEGSRCRVHFLGKVEFEFVGSLADRITVCSNHPLLIEHEEPEDSLYISTSTREPEAVLEGLRELCEQHFGGWRPLVHYLNDLAPAGDLLRAGYGLLLRGPRRFVAAAAGQLADHRINAQIHHGTARGTTLQVLELGRSYVVAEEFEFEPMTDAV